MSKYGKWIGGGLGWVLGGPIGALLGFAFGSMFDGMQSGKYEYKGQLGGFADGQQTQTGDFNVSLLILSAAVMRADGKVVKAELDYVKRFLIQQFGIDEAERQLLILREILKQQINLYEVCSQIKQYMEYPSRLQLLHYLFGISSADGQFHPSETDTIQQISNYLGISVSDFASIKAMFFKDNGSAYKILEVSPDASDEEVKSAYRKMAQHYHPDKVSHLGEDIQKAAQEKFQKLNNAYSEIKKQRGMN